MRKESKRRDDRGHTASQVFRTMTTLAILIIFLCIPLLLYVIYRVDQILKDRDELRAANSRLRGQIGQMQSDIDRSAKY